MGSKAAELLFGRLDGSRAGDPQDTILQTSFTIRNSCSAPSPELP
jgi:DNA-binding LacI/PurR family transcriptional regulator